MVGELRDGLWRRWIRVFGRGLSQIILILLDVGKDKLAPGVRAKGVDVFVLGNLNGLEERLGKIGKGSGGAGFDLAAGDCGEEAAQSGGQIAGGEVIAGEEIREVAPESFGGLDLRLLAGVEAAKLRMAGLARNAAAAAVGEGEGTQRGAVFRAKGRHRSLLTVGFG